MNLEYSEHFLKDLKKLRGTTAYTQIQRLCFEELPECEDLSGIRKLKKIQGHTNYYRIRVGDYRIGIKAESDTVIIMRVLHRKDIYRVFPKS